MTDRRAAPRILSRPVTAAPFAAGDGSGGQEHVVVFRALPGLGDFLCAIPTLRALRSARPSARIHLIGLEGSRQLAARFRRYIDEFHAFPGHPALPDGPAGTAVELDAFVAAIRSLRPALAIQLHGSGEQTNDIVARFEAQQLAGFNRPGAPSPGLPPFLPWDDSEPEPRRGLRLLRALGMSAHDDRLEFPLDPPGRERAAALIAPIRGARYVVVHPGAAREEARWSVSRFGAVVDALAAAGFRVVATGTAAEAALAASIAARRPAVLDLAGRTDLDELGWIIRGSRLVVANDTGVAHLVAALDVPSVVVFPGASRTHVRRWRPLEERRHRTVAGSSPRVALVLAEASRLLGAQGIAR